MTPGELCEEIAIELEWMHSVIREIKSLRGDIGDNVPAIREKTLIGKGGKPFHAGNDV